MNLFLCDTIEEFNMLSKVQRKNLTNKDVLIGTVESRFYLYCKSNYPNLKCELVEYSGKNKNDIITDYLRGINNIMGDDIEKKYIFEVDYSIEGSGIAQEIANVVYNTETCMALYEKYKFNKMYIYCNKNNYLIVEILREISKQKNIPIKIIYNHSLSTSNILERIFISSNNRVKRLKYLYYYLRLSRMYLKFLIACFKYDENKSDSIEYYDVGRICFTDAIKHYNWGRKKVEECNKRFKYNIICAGTNKETYNRYLNEGIDVNQFEDRYVNKRYVLKQFIMYFKELSKILKRENRLRILHNKLDISQAIYHRIKQHLLITVPEGIKIDCIAKSYFEKNKYALIEGCMGGNSIYTRVFYYNTRRENTLFFRELNYDTYPIQPKYGQEVEANIIGLRFFCGNYGKEIYESYYKNGWNGESVFLKSSIGSIQDVIKTRPTERIKILWAPSYPLIGFYSYSAWYAQNEVFIQEISRQELFDLTIKYHINQDDYSIETLKEKFVNSRIRFIDKKEPIEKYLLESDIVVTNPSTVIYDAMLKNRVVMAIIEGSQIPLKKGLEFITCKNAIEVIKGIQGLVYDDSRWNERLQQQKEYVCKYLDNTEDDVNVMIAETLNTKVVQRR